MECKPMYPYPRRPKTPSKRPRPLYQKTCERSGCDFCLSVAVGTKYKCGTEKPQDCQFPWNWAEMH